MIDIQTLIWVILRVGDEFSGMVYDNCQIAIKQAILFEQKDTF